MSPQFAADVKALGEAAAAAFGVVAEAFARVGEALRPLWDTPLRRNQLALVPSPGALGRSEAGVPYPTQSGVEALRSRPGAPILGVWVDETHEFTKEYDDAVCEMREAGGLLPDGGRPIPGAQDPAGAAPRDPHEDEAADCGGWEDH